VTLTWLNPVANTDGSALPASQIASTRVEYGTCSGTAFGTRAGEVLTTGAVTTATVDRPVGTHCFRAYTRTLAGAESAPSNVAQKIILAAPNPPSNLVATGDGFAYAIQQTPDQLGLVAVGRIPPGTQCDTSQAVLGKFRVPVSSVQWVGSARPVVVFAECS
jgi:hypothetical protein